MFFRKISILIFFIFFTNLSYSFENYFLMLKNSKVNVRYGPSFDYPIKFIYKKKLQKINPKTKVNCYNQRLSLKNHIKIMKKYDYIVDGSDNFKTKFLINDFCRKSEKFLVTGAISKFDGHIFTFDFKNKNTPCIRSFFQSENIEDDILNCEYEGILGTVAGIIGTIQANEILKKILNIGKNLNGNILILDLLNLNFRKVKFDKIKVI